MAEKKLMVVVGGRTTEFEKAMRGVQKTMKKTSRDMNNIGKSLTTTVTLPIVAVGGFALKTGIEFESAFAGVRKTVNASEEELAGLSKGIRDMAKEIPAAATEIAGVAEAAGQLGIKTPNILSFTRTMIDLGESTNLSATDAATALARLANITGMPQTEFDKLGSTIVALGNNLATTESEIVEMGLRLAGAGKQVGMSEAEILGLAGALSSVGIEAQAGGSAFSKVMVNMQLATEKGGKKLDEFASVAGMSAGEFQQAFKKDAAGAIIAFIQGLSTAEERGMSAIRVLDDMGITEVRLRDSLLRAAGAGDLFNESIQIGTQAWGDNTALTKEAEQRYDTTAAQLEILKNKFSELGIKLYDSIGPILRDTIIPLVDKLINGIEKMVDWFGNLSPETQKTIVVIAGLAAVLGPILIIIAKIVGAISTLMPVITAVGSAIGGVLGGIAAAVGAPVIAIVAAIAAVIAIGVLLIKNWDKVKEFFIKLWDGIKKVFSSAWEWIKNLFLKYHPVGLVISHWDKIKEFFINLWDTVKDIFGAAWDWIVEIFKKYSPYYLIYANWDKIVDWFSGLWDKVKEVFSSAISSVSDFVTEKFNAISDFFGGIRDKIVGIFTTIKEKILGIWDGIVTGIKGFINKIISAINGMIKGMNKLKWDVPDWVPLIGGKTWGVNIPEIPTLHTGTPYFTPPNGMREGLALLERGEQVIPRHLAGAPQKMEHTGTITVKGVNDAGQMTAVVDIVIERLLQEVRA